MKIRTFVSLLLLIGTAIGESKMGHGVDANIFLAGFFVVLGLSRA